MMRYIVATIKPWNLDAFARRVPGLPGEGRLMDDPDALDVHEIALSGLPVTVNTVLGAGSPDIDKVSELYASKQLQGTVHINTSEIAGLMVAADLAIGAAGSTSWERCCLGLPGLIVSVAENQRFIAEQLAKAGACIAIADDASAEDFAKPVTDLTARPARVREMSEATREICDGRGTDRVYAEIAEEAA